MRECTDNMQIDPNLARARTLPSSAYVDPALLELEKERIFSRTWQLVVYPVF
jgi:phenylpropionate dioxygenase-like ring-hydroxylating dioxygenase large terminal subunit